MISYDKQTISEMGIISNEVYDNDPSGIRYFKDDPEDMLVETAFGTTSYTVIDYIDTPYTNMQALLLQKTGTDKYVIAFRGTQEFADKLVDATIGINNFNPQFSAARDFVQDMITEHNIRKDNLTLTGHSLGGILTQSVGAVMGIKGYAFNPYGTDRLLTTWPQFAPSLGEALLHIGLYKILDGLGLSHSYADFADENILNISFNDFGTMNGDPLSNLATALTSEHIGAYLAIFGDNVSAGNGHRMPVLNAAIAQYNAILDHFAPETTYADLSKVYVLGGDDGYNRINDIFADLHVMDAPSGSLQLNFLFDADASTLQAGASSLEGMYALRNLLPFTISGADYSSLNRNGELNPDNYSSQYLEDRATFLYYTMHENTTAIQYDQEGSGIRVAPPSDIHVPARYWFGTDQGDNLYGHPGANREDHLYGMAGDDTLTGNGGDDILEGGTGSDTLIGGTGNDTFIIHGTDPDAQAFDTFNGGEGTDTILGGDQDDTIRVNSLSLAENSIEVIDGGGGENILAGTGGDDIIDLTGINVSHINRIEGGGGQDHFRRISG